MGRAIFQDPRQGAVADSFELGCGRREEHVARDAANRGAVDAQQNARVDTQDLDPPGRRARGRRVSGLGIGDACAVERGQKRGVVGELLAHGQTVDCAVDAHDELARDATMRLGLHDYLGHGCRPPWNAISCRAG